MAAPVLAPASWLDDADLDTLAEGGLIVSDAIVPAALALAAAGSARAWAEAGRLTPAGVGRAGAKPPVEDVRGDRTAWLGPDVADPGLTPLRAWFEGLREVLRVGARLPLRHAEVQLAAYPPGAVYKRHLDAFRDDPARLVTAIVYLNPDWHDGLGGHLRAWTPDGEVRVAPKLGRLVVFRSDAVPHAVTAATAPRFAATAWYRAADAVPGVVGRV